MPRTQSTMLPLGTQAPDFSLPDVVSGDTLSLGKLAERKALLTIFLSPHCPFVKHVQTELSRIGNDYVSQNVAIIAISANDPEQYPDDAPDKLKEFAQGQKFPFPVLFDESQATAKAYTAACTPDIFLFDERRALVYRGQIDGSRPGNEVPVTGGDLRAALDAVLAGTKLSGDQRPSIGCNIKWKAGGEPDYVTRS